MLLHQVESEEQSANCDDQRIPMVSVVIPCLNEEKTLGLVISTAMEALSEYGYTGEIIVADNGSHDRSRAIAIELGAHIVDVPERGYGSALMSGIEAARGHIIVMADADNTYDFKEMNRLIVPITCHGYELVLGTRLKGVIEEGAMPPLHRHIGTPILTWLINYFFRTNISDCNCGLRAFTRATFKKLELHSMGMEFASEMVVKAGLLNIRIGEVPVSLRFDVRGRTPYLNTWNDGWRHLRFILTYAADQLFFKPGIVLTIIGLTGLITLANGPIVRGDLFMDYHFLFPSSLSVILGTNLILFTLIARVYTGLSKYVNTQQFLRRIITVERGMLVGIILFLGGLSINIFILCVWLNSIGQGLFAVRPAVIALTMMVVGAQTFFSSILISLLKIPHRVVIEKEKKADT